MKLRWSQRAQDDLVEIARFIAQDNPAAARAWVKRLRERARQAAASPLSVDFAPLVSTGAKDGVFPGDVGRITPQA